MHLPVMKQFTAKFKITLQWDSKNKIARECSHLTKPSRDVFLLPIVRSSSSLVVPLNLMRSGKSCAPHETGASRNRQIDMTDHLTLIERDIRNMQIAVEALCTSTKNQMALSVWRYRIELLLASSQLSAMQFSELARMLDLIDASRTE
ncbi:hypothetical protein [Caballeronia sp. GACF4]|uniref:hypothetical protein n=1 Tax=Caballeronia sp. GACF4 TaxID=2921763 RepID=UPI0020288E19|nr:hypothetical protein [Caballeronia sp. GACF4]